MKRRDALTLAGATGATLLGGCLSSSGGGDDGGDGGDTATPTGTTATGGDTTTAGDGSGGDGTSSGDGRTTLTGRSLRTVATDCFMGGQSATAGLGDGSLVLTGTIKASDPCHVATAESVSVGGDGRTVTVTVGVSPDGADACTECVGAVEYEADIGYTGATPEAVVVEHRTMGETTTVLEGNLSVGAGIGGSVGEDSASSSGPAEGSDSDGSAPDGGADIDRDYGLRTVGSGCGSGGEATVAFEGDRVTVSGRIGASDPCHEARLLSAGSVDGRYVVELGVAATDADMCASCVAAVGYEGFVAFPDGLPETVAVVHHGDDGPTEVASATR